MASPAVTAAVTAQLASWTRAPVVDPNTQQEEPPVAVDGAGNVTAQPYLVVQYPVATSTQSSIGAPGANVWRERGVIRFVLNIPRAVGIGQAMGWMDELIALFRGQKFGGVNTWGPSSPILDDSNDVGNFWVLTSAVEYYADIIG